MLIPHKTAPENATSVRKHFVVFYSPGTFMPEQTSKHVDDWDTKVAVELSKTIVERYEATPHSFRFYTMLGAEDVPDGEGGFLRVEPKEIEDSPLFYLGGALRTFDEVKEKNDPKDRRLLDNMWGDRMWVAIENRNSFMFTGEFDETCCIVGDNGEIIRRGSDQDLVEYRAKKNMEKDEEMAKLVGDLHAKS